MESEITELILPEDKNLLCRFCLTLSKNLTYLHSQAIECPKTGNTTIQDICSNLCIKVDEAEYLPRGICYQCKNSLEVFFMFKEKIARNQEILHNVYCDKILDASEEDQNMPQFCTENNVEFIDLGEIESIKNATEIDHNYVLKNEKINEPSLIKSDYNFKESITSQSGLDEKSDCIEKIPEALVHFSPYSTSSMNQEEQHEEFNTKSMSETISTKLVEEVAVPEKKRKHAKNATYREIFKSFCISQCSLCSRKFSSESLRILHYVEHIRKATEGIVPHRPFCKYCGLLPTSKYDLDQHISLKHQDEKNVHCQRCEIRFSDVSEVLRHVEKDHVENYKSDICTRTSCPICGKIFEDVSQLMKHSLVHITGRHRCKRCNNIYVCSAALNQHHREHPQYRFKCKLCEKLVCTKMQLYEHMKSHIMVKNFQCKKCKERFNTKSDLRYHQKTHTNSKHMCHCCGYITTNINSYRAHLRSHTNSGTLKCNFQGCEKMFKTYGGLSSHIKNHLMIKNFSCEFCDYKTNSSYTLNRHKMKHTGEKPFSCPICEKSFSRQFSLTLHLRTPHKQL